MFTIYCTALNLLGTLIKAVLNVFTWISAEITTLWDISHHRTLFLFRKEPLMIDNALRWIKLAQF